MRHTGRFLTFWAEDFLVIVKPSWKTYFELPAIISKDIFNGGFSTLMNDKDRAAGDNSILEFCLSIFVQIRKENSAG